MPNIQGRSSAWRPRQEPMLQFKSEPSLLTEFPLAQGRPLFVLFRPSTDWMRPTHNTEDNLLSNLLIYLLTPFKTHPTKASRITFDQVLGHWDLAKQTHQVNHHTGSSILLLSVLSLPSVTLFPFFRGGNNMFDPPDSRSLLFPHFMCLKLYICLLSTRSVM